MNENKQQEIKFSQDDYKFLLEMINVLNFPGREAEKVASIKEKIKSELKSTT